MNIAEAQSGVALLEDRELLPKDQILKGELPLAPQQRPERS